MNNAAEFLLFAIALFISSIAIYIKMLRFTKNSNRKKRSIWDFLSSQGGVDSFIIDSNPRVEHVLQQAFRGTLRPLGDDNIEFVKHQIISLPSNDWIAAYVRSDLLDKPFDGKPEYFKADTSAFVFARRLNGAVPEVSFVNKTQTKHRPLFYVPAWKAEQGVLTACEGVFTKNFDVYARPVEQIDALAFAAPDLLETIEKTADVSDVYFVGEYAYFIMPVHRVDEQIVKNIFETSKELIAEANTNLPRRVNTSTK